MTSPKSFDHQSISRSSDKTDRERKPNPVESIAAEEAWALHNTPHTMRDDARWLHSMNAAPRTRMTLGLQQTIGNQAVQRMLAQRRGKRSFTVDDDTQARIQRERNSGQSLDPAAQVQMSRGIGHDFSDVRVHTSSEADDLSKRLGALAFTNGADIFFRAGRYDPVSSSGQELLAHELTHVVQQSSGAVGTHPRMTVNPPDDAFEQAADAVARQVMSATAETRDAAPSAMSDIQRETLPEEEEPLQTKADPGVAIQRQDVPEEEVQTKADPGAVIQREELSEEEEAQPLQTKADSSAVIQRQADEGDAGDVLPPPVVPSVSGTAELTSLDGEDPYFAQAFGKWSSRPTA